MKTPLIYITLNENAQYYECGFSCDNALILRIDDERYFFTDARYSLEAKESTFPHTQVIESSDFLQSAQEVLKKAQVKELIFNPQELSLALYQSLEARCEAISCSLKPKANFHQYLRIIKTQDEIDKIAKSQKLNKKAFKHFGNALQKMLKKSPNEKQLHYQAMGFLSHFGDYELSFEPIVGINANAAKPHALPSPKCLLHKNDVLLFDAGIKYQRYCSDMTRTASIRGDINFSKKQHFKDPFVQKIYDIVLKAQEETIQKARTGMSGKEIDAIARGVIEKSGYGEYFVHSTGHGVGLDIHELPRISRLSEDIIEDNMVFSIEPGIYLPQKFGIRIEDLVVMKNGRPEVL
ncbi:M24 family metallopeptidase [Helicobacter marmotae]|uniref:Aminopeptidase P family protein n=1 Tax=Helicobacter marmotae TaxID=152490 RepID=A0A3D8I3I3_9HELI|nr:aminopeptidase P family protein [Helicobacter marmotae]RDU59720.1 aminopeptidase P family protein [Helicobacter marmotae]